MKAYLSFKLPEEKEEHELALNGAKYKYALDEMDEYLRKILKYDDTITTDKESIYKEVRDKLRELVND